MTQITPQKFKALDEGREYDFTANDKPKCPHCNYVIYDMTDEYQFFQDGYYVTTCGSCGEEYEVRIHVKYSFDTYKQKRD